MLGVDFDLVGLSAATRYMRSPSAFSDVNVKPSFFRTTPAKKPRTECCCHPVAFMIAAMVAPCGRRSIAMTLSCFEPVRPFTDVFGRVRPFDLRGADLRDRCGGFLRLLRACSG